MGVAEGICRMAVSAPGKASKGPPACPENLFGDAGQRQPEQRPKVAELDRFAGRRLVEAVVVRPGQRPAAQEAAVLTGHQLDGGRLGCVQLEADAVDVPRDVQRAHEQRRRPAGPVEGPRIELDHAPVVGAAETRRSARFRAIRLGNRNLP